MRRLSSFVALLLLLTMSVPVLACVTGRRLSPEERACCRAMRGKCAAMGKMTCCRNDAHTDAQAQLASTAPSGSFQWTSVAWLAPALPEVREVSPPLRHLPSEHPPPGLLLVRSTVRRI